MLALEKHYSIPDLSALWGFSRQVLYRVFENEPDVIKWGVGQDRRTRSRRVRRYVTLRVPESVAVRVHARLRGQ
jgi:hypothetical protein